MESLLAGNAEYEKSVENRIIGLVNDLQVSEAMIESCRSNVGFAGCALIRLLNSRYNEMLIERKRLLRIMRITLLLLTDTGLSLL